MNILFYEFDHMRVPQIEDPEDSDDDENFVSINAQHSNKKGQMIDVFISLVSDPLHRILI
jgi:hypothetical protein